MHMFQALSACLRGMVVILCMYVQCYISGKRGTIHFYGILKISIAWILLKMLCPNVLATFADHHLC